MGLNCFWVTREPPVFPSPKDEKLKLIPVSNPDRGVIALFSFLLFFLYLDDTLIPVLSVGNGVKATAI